MSSSTDPKGKGETKKCDPRYVMVCGKCPYRKMIGGGRYKPPVDTMLGCSLDEDCNPRQTNTQCDRDPQVTTEPFFIEKHGALYEPVSRPISISDLPIQPARK